VPSGELIAFEPFKLHFTGTDYDARGCSWWGEDQHGVPVALVTDLFGAGRALPPDLRRARSRS
jgi:hypothetical protein